MDPGSAAHRHSASKTRVNALMALRSVRGTHRHPRASAIALVAGGARSFLRASSDGRAHVAVILRGRLA